MKSLRALLIALHIRDHDGDVVLGIGCGIAIRWPGCWVGRNVVKQHTSLEKKGERKKKKIGVGRSLKSARERERESKATGVMDGQADLLRTDAQLRFPARCVPTDLYL